MSGEYEHIEKTLKWLKSYEKTAHNRKMKFNILLWHFSHLPHGQISTAHFIH